MNRDEYNTLFHRLQLNLVAFKRLMDCDEEVLKLVNAAIEAEREACAKVCMDKWMEWMDSRVGNEILDNSNCPDAEDCAFAIRERGAP